MYKKRIKNVNWAHYAWLMNVGLKETAYMVHFPFHGNQYSWKELGK